MKLSLDDLEKIEFDNFFFVNQVNLSIGSYYAKFCSMEEIFRELLGQMVFELVGIECAKYEYIPQKKCLLSKDLHENRILKNLTELGIKGNTLFKVYEGIACNFSNYKQLKLSIEIMHFIDLLFSNIDRHTSNFAFSINDDNSAELVVYDNGYFLDYYSIATRPVAVTECTDFFLHSKKEEAVAFISCMSDEMKLLVPKYLELFTPEKVETMINNIKKRLNIEFSQKQYHMKKFRKNYNMVCKLMKIKKQSWSFKLFK